MFASITRLSSLLIGVALLLTGHGLQLALIPLRAQINGWTSVEVGYLSAVYFTGFIVGCFSIPRLVARIGHVRTFSTLTAAMTAALLSLSFGDNIYLWLALRFIVGVTIVGLYLVIESWLNSLISNEVRGGVLAAYTVVVLAGLALGQLLLNAAPPEGDRLFVIAAMLVVLAAIPICVTRTKQPAEIPSARFSPMLVIRTSRAATLGAFISGAVTGTYYGLGPVYGLQIELSISQISMMMALGIIGGALMQLPLGRLSDSIDRRKVLFIAMLCGAAVAAAGTTLNRDMIPYVMLVFGGFAMPIYALSLAQASDHAEPESFLEIGTGLLMINATGSIIGPLVISRFMDSLGPSFYFAALAAILLLGAVLILVFIRSRDRVAEHHTDFTVATSAVGQAALQMDPRTDEEETEVMEGEVISKPEQESGADDKL
ncbi:MAG: MFS transporter [Pseudohongiellaceae bacterium]